MPKNTLMMKLIILKLLIISASCLASNVKLESHTQYDDVHYHNMPLQLIHQIGKSLAHFDLKAAFTNSQGSKLLRVNMMYSDSFLSSKVIVKYKTKGNYKLNKEYQLKNGYLIHLKLDDHESAIYFENISLEIRRKIISKLNNQKSYVYNFIPIKKANANCDVSLSGIPTTNLDTQIANNGAGAVLSSCMSGIATGAEESTIGMVKDVYNGVTAEAKKLWEDPGKRLGEYWGFVSTGAQALWDFTKILGSLLVNPTMATKVLSEKFGQIGSFFSQTYQNIKEMPATQQAQILCNIIGSIGVDVLIAAITVGAGSGKLGLTITKLLLKLKKITKTIGKGLKISFKVLEKLSDKVLDQIQFIIKAGNKNKLQLRMREVGCAL